MPNVSLKYPIAKSFCRCYRQFALISLLALLTWPLPGPEVRADEGDASSHNTRKATATLSLQVYEKLQRAIEAHQGGDSNEALQKLDRLKSGLGRLNGHEKARLWSAYAMVYYGQEDFSASAGAYRKALSEAGVPEQLRTSLLYSLAQVHFIQEDFNQSLARLEQWLARVDSPDAAANVFIGQVYYQLQRYRQATPFVERALSARRGENKAVPESWYLLLNALYYEQKAYRKSFRVMLALVHDYPRKQYYTQLSALYAELKQPFEQYSVKMAMQDAGLLTSNAERVGFAQMLLMNERPFRAARVLEAGLAEGVVTRNEKNLRLLANAWMMAREHEKALEPLSQAAALSEKGELYLMLAQSYLNLDRWRQANEAAAKALQQGGLKRPDQAQLIRGMALFNLGRYGQALGAFEKAKKDARSRKQAAQWIKYVKAEQARLRQLAEMEAALTS